MKTKRVRPILVESNDKITLNSIVNDPTLGLGIIIERHGEECFCKTHSSGGSIIAPWKKNLRDRLKHRELILISLEDEKIEVGNEYLDDCGLIRKAVTSDEDYWKRRPDYKKVIARQSQISPEYISKFIEQYNQNCVEDLEIELEYFENDTSECIGMDGEPNCVLFNGFTPKLTNGFVIIVEKEPISYTEEEVRKLISEALYHFCPMNNYRKEDEIDWFENNKKK